MNPFLDSLCNFASKNIGLLPGVNFEWFPGPQDIVGRVLSCLSKILLYKGWHILVTVRLDIAVVCFLKRLTDGAIFESKETSKIHIRLQNINRISFSNTLWIVNFYARILNANWNFLILISFSGRETRCWLYPWWQFLSNKNGDWDANNKDLSK
mgnify:CR=1 FL=1